MVKSNMNFITIDFTNFNITILSIINYSYFNTIIIVDLIMSLDVIINLFWFIIINFIDFIINFEWFITIDIISFIISFSLINFINFIWISFNN